ncbi:hypothetical protein [Haloplanus aerogenes]|nr:hypothetical protein [Haloplanus aerogenes]
MPGTASSSAVDVGRGIDGDDGVERRVRERVHGVGSGRHRLD